MTGSTLYVIKRPLTGELADARSPVRQFFRSRFSGSLRNAQSCYRHSPPALTVPPVQRTEVGLGTVGTGANWLLRFLLHSSPVLEFVTDHSSAGARPAERGELAPAGPGSRQ